VEEEEAENLIATKHDDVWWSTFVPIHTFSMCTNYSILILIYIKKTYIT